MSGREKASVAGAAVLQLKTRKNRPVLAGAILLFTDRPAGLRRVLSKVFRHRSKEIPKIPWTVSVAKQALLGSLDGEKALVLRVAEARGQRVPMSELGLAFSLPSAPALEQDFPGLTKFCSAPTKPGEPAPAMPVLSGGSGADGWYWMSPDDANAFRRTQTDAAEA
jgi:hypothetical protein